MENNGEGLNVPPAAAAASSWQSRDLKPMSSAHIKASPNSNASYGHAKPEPQIRENTDDAIWEEAWSPNLKPRVQMGHAIDSPQTAEASRNGGDANQAARYAQSHHSQNGASWNDRCTTAQHSLDRLPTQINLPVGRSSIAEPRHRSLDFDIHINEPILVALQDASVKPLSDHLNERNFSFRPKRSDGQIDRSPPSSTSQQVVRMVSSSKISSKPPPSPRQPRESQFTPLEVRVDEDDEEDREERRVSSAKSPRSESKRKPTDHGMDVKVLLADGEQGMSGREGDELGRASGVSSAAGSCRNIRSMPRTVVLAKTRTKSRLVEPPVPSSPGAASVGAVSRRMEGAKKAAPQSPGRPSVCKAETDAEEEDPFQDADEQDKFRQGNFKAITIAQWVAFIILMGGLVCSLTVKEIKGHHIWGLELWKWFLLVLVVLCGRLVSGWLIRILVIIFEKNFLLRKKVLYFVYGLRKSVQNCLWLGLALLAWRLMFDPRVDRSTKNHKTLQLITKLLECFLIAAFIWLGKVLFVKSLASSFHVNTFFDRIQESLYHQQVLEALTGPPLLDISFDRPLRKVEPARPATVSLARGVAAPGKKDDTSNPIKIENLQRMSAQNVSAGLMMQLMNLVKHPGIGTLYTTFDEDAYANDTEDIEINSEVQAKAAAKMIFKNVAQEPFQSIERDDLLRFVTAGEIDNVLCLFEGAKDTGKITKKALKNWVVSVYQERKALAHSLNDTKTAVKELHRMASVAVIIIIIVVWLLVLEIATTHVLLFVSSQLLLVGFIFSNTVKQIFEAIIFLFVMHPFDVGDRCIIDGQQMVVEEMKIMSTVFLKPDNEKVFYPNAVLATKPISNLYRSPNMGDVLSFSVHISTPSEKIIMLKEKIAAYVERKTEYWQPKFSVLVRELEDMNRMRITVGMNHTINFQNALERLSRRSELLLELKRLFTELGIEYRLLTQQVQISYGDQQGGAPTAGGVSFPPPTVPYQGQVV